MDARTTTADCHPSAPPRTRRFRTAADVRWFLAALRRARVVRRRLAQPLPGTIVVLAALAATLTSERYTHTALADGTGVILDIEGMHVLTLNQTGEFLIAAVLASAADDAELVSRMVAEFEVEAPQAQADVVAFIAELSAYLA